MKIDKQQKNYIIHVQSVHTPVFAQRVNSMYSGTSDEIIEKVFKDISAEQAELIIDNTCDTSGRYIAPNITAREALGVLVNNAYDNEKTGMFLYERLVDKTALRLTSLSGMFNNNFVDSGGDPVSVKSASVDMETNFVDYVRICCRSGKGGAGSVHFHRDKLTAFGGPDGGNGGRGGHIILRGNKQFWTLIHLKYRKHIIAEGGINGSSGNSTGKQGEDDILDVPLGTVARDAETGEIIAVDPTVNDYLFIDYITYVK